MASSFFKLKIAGQYLRDTQFVVVQPLVKASTVAAAGKSDPQADLIASIIGLKLEDTQTILIMLVSLLVEAGSVLGYFVVFSMWKLEPSKSMAELAMEENLKVELAKSLKQAKALKEETAALLKANKQHEEEKIQREKLFNDNDKSIGLEISKLDQPALEILDPVRLPKNEMDRFYDARIMEAEGQSVTATELYDDYCAWSEAQGSNPMSQIPFGKQLSQRKIQKAKIAGRIRYKGIKLQEKISKLSDKATKIGVVRVA